MTAHVFVDETKEAGYLVAATFLDAGRVTAARQQMAALVLPRQRRIHFKGERDDRRRQILDVIAQLGVRATIYDASGHRTDRAARTGRKSDHDGIVTLQCLQPEWLSGAHRPGIELYRAR